MRAKSMIVNGDFTEGTLHVGSDGMNDCTLSGSIGSGATGSSIAAGELS